MSTNTKSESKGEPNSESKYEFAPVPKEQPKERRVVDVINELAQILNEKSRALDVAKMTFINAQDEYLTALKNHTDLKISFYEHQNNMLNAKINAQESE